MHAIAGIFNNGTDANRTRDELRAQMALLPPPNPADVAFLVANADVIRDDYAMAFGSVYDTTDVGKRAKLLRYGIGAACGLVLGLAAGKFVL